MNPTIETDVNSDGLALLRAMRAGVDYSFQLRLRQAVISVRPITIDENVRVVADAMELIEKLPKPMRNKITEDAELAKKMLEVASTTAPGKMDPQLTPGILGLMTNDEIIKLYRDYLTVVEKVDPSMETITVAELQELVDTLKKNPEALKALSHQQVMAVADYFLTQSA